MTGCQAVSYALALVPAGLLPATSAWPARSTSPGPSCWGLFIWSTPRGSGWTPATCRARRLLRASFVYLPAILLLAVAEPAAVLTSRPAAARRSFCHASRVDYHDGFATHSSTAPEPAGHGRRPRATSRAPCAGHARQGRDVAVPGHGSHVLHRADRVVHRPPRRQPAHRLQQPLLARRRRSRGSKTRTASCSTRPAASHEQVEHILHTEAGLTEEAGRRASSTRAPHGLVSGLDAREGRGARSPSSRPPAPRPKIEPLKTYNWPLPYDELTNPLAINLTAANTFILICSSVTMVLALVGDSGRQAGARASSSCWPPS